jgi:hypothetical protein
MTESRRMRIRRNCVVISLILRSALWNEWPNYAGLHITRSAYHPTVHISTHNAVLIRSVAIWRYEANSTLW